MTIPFLSYFKRGKAEAKAKASAPAASKPAPPPLEKPSSERFSKTVMPNASRTVAPQDPFQMAARSTAMGGQMATATAVAPPPASPRTISFAAPAPAKARDLPAAVALAMEPNVERVISLELADVVAGMPPGQIKPLGEDENRRILLRASEVEKGMANGKPTVSLATIYQQVPEIFLRTISPSDTGQVELPFAKVLDQFTNLHVRADQERHLIVPQVETPFLKVAVEDCSEFGTTLEPLAMQPGELPSVRIQPPTAEAFAAAEPEPAVDERPKMSPASANGKTTQSPTRIPFKLSPNGTDAPAPESVPASSGPSVPNISPMPPAPAPVRIPFKMTAPSDDLRPKAEPWLTKESLATASEAAVEPPVPVIVPEPVIAPEVKIALPLLPILRNLPPMQLTGDPANVPAEARLELPFALIEPQLASGRISVTAKVFETSLPAEYRSLFEAGPGAVDVSLPLQEVLKNLPAASLRMRDDQEEQEAGQNFATPFSAKAEEDAKLFNVPATPVAKPVVAPVADVVTPPAAEPIAAGSPQDESVRLADVSPATEPGAADTAATPGESKTAETAGPGEAEKASDRPLRSPLQVALDTDEKLDAKGVIAHVNKIPGVKACAVLFGDGLSLAGSLPAELDTEGLCAMAPALMQRIENHLVDTKLGALRGMTLSCVKGAITFYMHENLCLAALHAETDLPSETRDKLSRIVHELSRKYSHPV